MNRLKAGPIVMALMLALSAISCAGTGGTKATGTGTESATYGSNSVLVTDLKAVPGDGSVSVILEGDGPFAYTVYTLDEPARLIVDLSQTDLSGFRSIVPVGSDPVGDIIPEINEGSENGRLEISLTSPADYSVDDSDPQKLVINISKAIGGEKEAEIPSMTANAVIVDDKAEEKKPAPEMTIADIVAGDDRARVENLEFVREDGADVVLIKLSRPDQPYEVIAREKMKRLTIDLPGVLIDKEDERVLNVYLDDSPVKNLAVFQFRGGDDPLAKVVVNLARMEMYDVSGSGREIRIKIGDQAVLAMAQKQLEEESIQQTVGPSTPDYAGNKISLDFQKADIHNILRILADVSGKNIITSDKVKGQVTMKLVDVPWDLALDVILKNNGLDKIEEGNIIRIATPKELAKEHKALEEKINAEITLSPLYTRIIEVNYETAENMKTNLESMKSERGKIEINSRTNSLIIQDTKNKLVQMADLISKLDKKEQQVLIEARIVEIVHSTALGLGIQWGGYAQGVTGKNFPNTIGVTGGAGANPQQPNAGGSLVSLPIAGAFGALGITLGHVNGTALLDARLMAMERKGNGRIISMPRITTMNNKEAIIESGTEVPYLSSSSLGTQVEFKKATLKLVVTPHVTPDKHVRLDIKANKDTPDWANATTAGPPIRTKSANTEVLVNDGETTVIGGLFQNSDQVTNRQVPLFGDIPFLGWLFKGRENSRESDELLIFITPRVLQ